MSDPRHCKLAEVLVNYSVALKPKQTLGILSLPTAAPLVREVYRQALRAGAYPTARALLGPNPPGIFTIGGIVDILLEEGNKDQLSYLSELDVREMEHYDALIVIWGEENTKAISGADPEKTAMLKKSQSPLSERMIQREAAGELNWCLTLFPTPAHAQDADMSLSEYEDFVFGAGHLNDDDPIKTWQKIDKEQQRIADFLTQHDHIRIVAPETEINYRVGGRTWLNANGRLNFPDGEVYTGPHEDSVNGTVRFTYPAVYTGKQVEDVRLTFKDGKVVEAQASRGQDVLDAMLGLDAGARFVGEVAFGLNYDVKQFTANILFDEKIGGTMHMALGRSYPETGGKNKSDLHWDMICDLREGQVYADGELCYEKGEFTI